METHILSHGSIAMHAQHEQLFKCNITFIQTLESNNYHYYNQRIKCVYYTGYKCQTRAYLLFA